MSRYVGLEQPEEMPENVVRRIVTVLVATHGWSENFARGAVVEFTKFMRLKGDACDFDAEILSPSGIVDAVWHAAILDTKYYQYPSFNHDPVSVLEDPDMREIRYAATVASYREKFGEPPSEYWETPSRQDGDVPSIKGRSIGVVVNIRGIFGRRVVIGTGNTVDELKKAYVDALSAEDATHLSHNPASYAATFNEMSLCGDSPLTRYEIKENDVVTLRVRLRGC